MNKNNKIPLALLIALVGFPQISETIYTPALPNIANSLAANVHAVEATLAIYFIGFALGVALLGALSDFLGRKPVMLGGIIIYAIATFICGHSATVESLLFWRFVQAFGASVGSVITQTMLRDLYEGKERARLFSIIGGALAFSPMIGPLLGGYLSDLLGWRSNFWTLFALGIVLLAWSWLRLQETLPKIVLKLKLFQIKDLAIKMGSSRNFWCHVFLIGATNGILFSFYEEGPFLFIKYLGLSASQYGLLGLLIGISTVIAARFSCYLQRFLSPENIISMGSWIALIGSGFLNLAISLDMLVLGAPFIFVLCALLAVFTGISLIIPNSLSIAMRPYQFYAGTAGSLFGACYYCLIGIFTWGMSLLHDGSPYPLPIYLAALCILLLLSSQALCLEADSNVPQKT